VCLCEREILLILIFELYSEICKLLYIESTTPTKSLKLAQYYIVYTMYINGLSHLHLFSPEIILL